jgi:hypothetical protein
LSKDKVAILLQVGAISLVQAPPLETFSGWQGRAAKLDSLGIDTVAFITMDSRDVAYAIRASVRKEEEDQATFDEKTDRLALAVTRWQGEIKQLLGIGGATVRR